ncbi:MAG: tetratricopeptide repeat protein [Myxococcota bacterium]
MTIKELLHRRVPQFVGAYLVAGWGLVQFVQFLESRYTLGTQWVDLVGLGWLLALPAVVSLAWHHGAPGRDPWTRGQVLSLFANAITAAVILILVFNVRRTQAATKTITVKDEKGTQLVREVPSDQDAVRSMVVYFLDNETGDPQHQWLAQAIPYVFQIDLLQDLFLDVRSPYQNVDLAARFGAKDVYNIPSQIQREIAERHHVDYYVNGSVKSVEPVEVELAIVQTDTAREVERKTFSGSVFSVIDDASLWARRVLGLPGEHIERNRDEPVADMVTASVESLRNYMHGVSEVVVNSDYRKGYDVLQLSVRADPTNALGQFQLFTLALLTRPDARAEADRAMNQMLMHLHRLPDRMQFLLKHYYYVNLLDPEKAFAVLDLWAKLIPSDPMVHVLRADVLQQRGQFEEAVVAMESALALFPGDISTRGELADVYRREGRWKKALEMRRQIVTEFPDDPASYVSVGDLLRDNGKLEDAYAQYEHALLLDLANIPAKLGQATLNARSGKLDVALAQLERLAKDSPAANDRADALASLRDTLEDLGRLEDAIRVHEQWVALGPLDRFGTYMRERAMGYRILARTGRVDEAVAAIDALASELPESMHGLLQYGRAQVALIANDPDTARPAIESLARFIQGLGGTAYAVHVDGLRSRLQLQEGKAVEALATIKRSIDKGPAELHRLRTLGAAQRANGEFEDALATFERARELYPASAESYYQSAKTLADMGRNSDALKHIDSALRVWEGADPSFDRHREAKELRAQLSGS